jgi:CheY-like chemotaxis protein
MKKSDVIMLMERSHEEIYLLEQALRKAKVQNKLTVVRHTDEAILYLRGVGVYGNRRHYPLPAILLIDLASAKQTGMELIRWVRGSSELKSLPIVVLAISAGSIELQEALKGGANAYVLKRVELDRLSDIIQRLQVIENPVRLVQRAVAQRA